MYNFTLVSGDGRPYITTTDRRALSTLLKFGAAAAQTPKKRYAIEKAAAGDLDKIIDRLQEKETGKGSLDFERRDAFKMQQTIEKERRAGAVLYRLQVEEKGCKYSYLFFM